MLNKNGKCGLITTETCSYKWTDGEIRQSYASYFKTPSQIELWVGNGTTPPTVDDYNLESRITDLHLVNKNVLINNNINNNYMMLITATFENNTSSDITITELGAVTLNNYYILFDREVIEPIVIPANGSKTFTITIG